MLDTGFTIWGAEFGYRLNKTIEHQESRIELFLNSLGYWSSGVMDDKLATGIKQKSGCWRLK
jgi:hypothetical protein